MTYRLFVVLEVAVDRRLCGIKNDSPLICGVLFVDPENVDEAVFHNPFYSGDLTADT